MLNTNTNTDQDLVNLFFDIFVIPGIKKSTSLVDAIAGEKSEYCKQQVEEGCLILRGVAF